jgi:hypothetical protein
MNATLVSRGQRWRLLRRAEIVTAIVESVNDGVELTSISNGADELKLWTRRAFLRNWELVDLNEGG